MDCRDKNCPEHGELATRGATILGRVVSDKMQKTVTVKAEYTVKVPKYQRYKRKHSKIKAHKPDCIDVKIGDMVQIAECRPLSKTVHFAVIKKVTAADALKEKAMPVEVERPGAQPKKKSQSTEPKLEPKEKPKKEPEAETKEE